MGFFIMNKRSLIFIVCVSAALFLVSMWFSEDSKKQAPKTPAAQTESITPSLSTTSTSTSPAEEPSKGEQFYVLENAYQQLVFSNE